MQKKSCGECWWYREERGFGFCHVDPPVVVKGSCSVNQPEVGPSMPACSRFEPVGEDDLFSVAGGESVPAAGIEGDVERHLTELYRALADVFEGQNEIMRDQMSLAQAVKDLAAALAGFGEVAR